MAANGQTAELIKHSVTAGDAALSSGGGVVQFIFPILGAGTIYGLPADLPVYWSYERDMVLRNSIMFESMWAAAVAIACTKQATMNFEVKASSDGDVSRTIDRYQNMLLQWGGREGYVMSQSKGVTDFLTTNNGEFHEIVRVSNASGSRVLGLVHLDSMRCMRTGNPAEPVLFRDLGGREHLMKDYQVIDLVDQPDPGLSWFGVGHCAAERAYRHIYKLAAIERYLLEKITGSGITEIEFVSGPDRKQFQDAKLAATQEQAQRGAVYYGGKLIVFSNSDIPLANVTIPVKSVPDGFDRKQELDIALLAYANSIGLVLTDLQPLSGQGLGTGAQTIVLEEKAQGRGLSARRKALGHKLNEWVLPSTVVSFFKERDLRDEATEAVNAQARAGVLETYATIAAITPQQALQAAVEADDLPRAFIEQDETPNESLSDEDKPTVESSQPVDSSEEVPATMPQPAAPSFNQAKEIIQKAHEIYMAVKDAG